MVITPRQIRAARGLLGWTQKHLSDHALVAPNTIKLIETGRVRPRTDTIEAIENALRRGGVEFLEGEGVRPRSHTRSRSRKLERPGG